MNLSHWRLRRLHRLAQYDPLPSGFFEAEISKPRLYRACVSIDLIVERQHTAMVTLLPCELENGSLCWNGPASTFWVDSNWSLWSWL